MRYLHRVADQVDQNLAQAQRITDQARGVQGTFDDQFQALFGGAGAGDSGQPV